MVERLGHSRKSWIYYGAILLAAIIVMLVPHTASAERLYMATSHINENEVLGMTLKEYVTLSRNQYIGGQNTIVNWPLRADTPAPVGAPNSCPARGAGLKTLPTLPSYDRYLNFGMADPYTSYDTGSYVGPAGGNNAHWSAGCMSWLFDAGTNRYGSYITDGISYTLNSRGPWLYPDYLAGWANIDESGVSTPGGSWTKPTRAPNWDTNIHFEDVRGDCGGENLCGPDYVIWYNTVKSVTNEIDVFSGTSFDNGTPQTVDWPISGGQPADRKPVIYSNGTMILRNKFHLSDEHYQRIINDPTTTFYLDILADDFFHAYINGVSVKGTETTAVPVALQLDADLLQSVLRPGDNLLAIQVLDKTISRTRDNPDHTNTAGVWFNLRAEIPEATPDVYPQVDTTSPSIVAPGQDVSFQFSARNDGWTSDGVEYQITYTRNGASFNPTAVSGGCDRGRAGLSLSNTGGNLEPLPNCASETINVSQAGRICAILTIYNPAPGVAQRVEDECVTVGIKPHVQVSGGDIIVRGSNSIIHAPALSTGTGVYGSWGEYGVFGPNNINTYSGGSLMASVNASLEDQRSLIFANNSEPLGHFASNLGAAEQTKLGDNWSQVTLASGTLNLNSITQNKRKHVRSRGDLSISGTLSGVSARIEVPNGKVTITGDIQYGISSVSTPTQLPQLIIVADSIEIAEGVKQVDGWLVANRLITCNDGYSAGGNYFDGLNTSRCNTILKLNGPIQAQSLVLRRTAGATGSGTAAMRQSAEMVNLRPDAYIWAFAEASGGGGKIRTETIKELPPRF